MYLKVRSKEGIQAIPIDKNFLMSTDDNTLVIEFQEKAFSKDPFRVLHFEYDNDDDLTDDYAGIMEWASK